MLGDLSDEDKQLESDLLALTEAAKSAGLDDLARRARLALERHRKKMANS